MKGLHIDYPKLRAAAWGKSREIQSALAINAASVSRKLNGKQKLALEELNTIAQVIGVDVTDFVYVREMEECPVDFPSKGEVENWDWHEHEIAADNLRKMRKKKGWRWQRNHNVGTGGTVPVDKTDQTDP